MKNGLNLLKLSVAVVLAALMMASAFFPVVGGTGYLMARTADDFAVASRSVVSKSAPEVTTITDRNGAPMAWLYDQRRINVPGDRIAKSMKDALVYMEDRRFWEHGGVDWKGTMRAAVKNFTSGSVQEGASTIEQQLIKNHNLLVDAETEAERRAATAADYGRKLREIRIAWDLKNDLSKDEILTKYLNLVPFGNGAFGVEVAAQTYFGVSAADLTLPQSAMLAGLVQQTTGLDPYQNPEGAKARRNDVLEAMARAGAVPQQEADEAKQTELGVLPEPQRLPRGCIASGQNGFFCDYVVAYLQDHGISNERLARGGYTIKTTLDPKVQENVQRSLNEQASPTAQGVAEVMNVIEPGQNSRRVLAMASSRVYGLDAANAQTVQPQPFTPVGNGAGSIFKVFAATSAVEKGLGVDTTFAVPRRYEAWGLGTGGAQGCPAGMYCVENVGSFPPNMTLREALAKSPNTPFIKMAELVGVDSVVDMAVRLGMKSYAVPGSFDGESSVQEYVRKHTLGSFVLGPTAINTVELANVGATLASDGHWCEPSPIEEITDAAGQPVEYDKPDCEQAVEPGVAHAVANALSEDALIGTAKDAASTMNWDGPVAAKTGTTESNQSSAFLGFTSGLAGAVYAYNDSPTVTELCTAPLRQCGSGDLFGGREPARTWFGAMNPIIEEHGGKNLPPLDPDYVLGTSITRMPDVVGLQEPEAKKILEEAGYKVESKVATQTGENKGIVVNAVRPDLLLKGGTITIYVSDGSRRPRAPRTSETVPPPAPRLPLPPPPINQGPSLGDIGRSLGIPGF